MMPIQILSLLLLVTVRNTVAEQQETSLTRSNYGLRSLASQTHDNIIHDEVRSLQEGVDTGTEPHSYPINSEWDENETMDTYASFPDAMKDYLDQEFQALMRGTPELGIFTLVMPAPNERRIWPLVKGMTLRNHLENKILWIRDNYLITSGLERGCREEIDDQEVEVDSSLCRDHCTHHGRYCAPELPAYVPEKVTGHDMVYEALRRLCIDGYYHASDHKYFDYLMEFEKAGCFEQDDVTQCSLRVIEKVPFLDYPNFADCVGDVDADSKNDKLEAQLQAAQSLGYAIGDMPSLRIGEVHYNGELTTEAIFRYWCEQFTVLDKPMIPASCDICAQCENVRHCLWTLECDGIPFDDKAAAHFLQRHGAPTMPPPTMSPTEKPTMTDATRPPANQQQEEGSPGGASDSNVGEETASTASGESSFNAQSNTEGPDEDDFERDTENSAVVTFFVIALVISAAGAGVIFYQDRRRSRNAKAAALTAVATSTDYRDTADFDHSYRDNEEDVGGGNDEDDHAEDDAGYIIITPRQSSVEMSGAQSSSVASGSPVSSPPPVGAFL